MNPDEDSKLSVAINILNKEPIKRSQKEIITLVQSTEHIQFFQKYNEEGSDQNYVHYKCCNEMHYQELKSGDIVFEMGSVGHTFYVILNGEAGIFISNQEIPKETIRQQRELGAPPTFGMILVKKLKTGDQFGELALLNNRPRMATIQCLSDCQFAVLHKKEFNVILKQQEQKILSKQLHDFGSLSICQGWNLNLVKYIYLNQILQLCSKNQVVYQEGQHPRFVYVVKSGEFSVRKNLQIPQTNSTEQSMMLQHEKYQEIFVLPSTYEQIKLIGRGEYFGEEDLILKQNCSFSVHCESPQSELICIRSEDFYHRIYEDEQYKKNIDKFVEIKADFMMSRIQHVLKPIKLKKQSSRTRTKLISQVKQNQKILFLPKRIINTSQVFYEMKSTYVGPTIETKTNINQDQVDKITEIALSKSKSAQQDLMSKDSLLRLLIHERKRDKDKSSSPIINKHISLFHKKTNSFALRLDTSPLFLNNNIQDSMDPKNLVQARKLMNILNKDDEQNYYIPTDRKKFVPALNLINLHRIRTAEKSNRWVKTAEKSSRYMRTTQQNPRLSLQPQAQRSSSLLHCCLSDSQLRSNININTASFVTTRNWTFNNNDQSQSPMKMPLIPIFKNFQSLSQRAKNS